MKIGILEFCGHHIFLYLLAIVAKESGANVTIFTTRDLYNLIAPLLKDRVKNYEWIIKDENEKISVFLKRVNKIAGKDLDLLFINTLQNIRNYPAYLFFKPKCKSILVTGRPRSWFGSKYQLIPFNGMKNLLIHNATHFMTKRVLPRYDAVLVHTQTLKDYVLKCGYEKNVFLMPFSIYEGEVNLRTNREKIRFVVIGMIAEARRDYDGLLQAFKKLWSSRKNINISLTLLGRPIGKYGESIINKCRFLKECGNDIHFYNYNNFIPEEIFRERILSSDVIISPIRLEKYPDGVLTAGLVEAIRLGKPGVYPLGYSLPKEVLPSSSLFYNKIEELPELIENNFLNNQEILKNLSLNAISNLENFSLQKVTEYFHEYIIQKFLFYSNI